MEKASTPSFREEKVFDSSSTTEENTANATPNNGEESAETELVYPTGLPFWLIVLSLCLAVFVLALDNTIIATAIPKITDRFNSLDDVAWYASAYMLTTGCFQLLFGRLYSSFSTKWIFIIAISIFEFGSLICGVTPSSIGLIVGRAIAGVGAAGIMSGAILILSTITPVAERAAYMGLIGGMYGIASVAGPLLGGVFTDQVTWRLCFYINLPIGLITILTVIFLYKPHNETKVKLVGWKQYLTAFDPTGNLVLIPAIICLFLALQWGGTTYAWGNGRIIGLFVVFGVLISVFIWLQFYNKENAMIPPRLFKNRTISAAVAFNFCVAGAFFILAYYVPIWFQAVKGESAIRSGILNLPLILGLVIASMISGIGTTVGGYYTPFLYLSTVIMAIGCGMISTWEVDSNSAMYLGWQAMAGLGIGLGLQVPFVAVQTVCSPTDLPMGTALVVFSQTIGGAIFVSVGQNIFTNTLVTKLKDYAPNVDAIAVLGFGATRIHTEYVGADLDAVKRSYNDALTRAFMISAILGALTVVGSLAMPWTNVKGVAKKVDEEVAEAGSVKEGNVKGEETKV